MVHHEAPGKLTFGLPNFLTFRSPGRFRSGFTQLYAADGAA